jgi:hypothetical protein
MAKHITYRGVTIDMEAISRANAMVPAIGNMHVNARGDRIKNGQVVKTVEEIARDRHKIMNSVTSGSLKDEVQTTILDQVAEKKSVAPTKTKKIKEVEDADGNITIEEDKNAN